MNWTQISASTSDHETFAANVGSGVLVRHVEYDGDRIVGVQLVFVPLVSLAELVDERVGKERSE